MSLAKNWKLYAGVLSVVFLSACAGSKSGGASSGDESQSFNEDGTPAAPKEEITEDKLKEAHTDAVSITEENHELRRQIFEAKNKLGIPVEQDADDEASK